MQNKKEILIGSSYYPERWPREEWAKDADLMQQAGFTFIRTGEFAWSKMEPRDGIFDFNWLDKAVEVFSNYGVSTIMCTPTAAPPPWITAKHPEILPVTQDGELFRPGQRRHYCFNNLNYRNYSERIVREMAIRYASHPAVIGWQIDNELGGENFICHCEVCRAAFQKWLRHKYQTLDELNRRWGGTFFSFEFTDWSEIPVPLGHNLRFFNPTFKKDYLHFASDSMKDFLFSQVAVLRRYLPENIPITTNRFDLFWTDKYDHTMDCDLDIIGLDNYYFEPVLASFHHDYYRSLKKNQRYWVLETAPESLDFGADPRDVILRSISATARGADLICYFSWRQIYYSCEQDSCSSPVDFDGNPKPCYATLQKTNALLFDIWPDLSSLKCRNDLAILYSYESNIIYSTSQQFDRVKYLDEVVTNFYTPLFELGLGVDFIFNLDEIWRYRMVIIPLHILEFAQHVEKIRAYVKQGGVIITTGDCGLKTSDNWRTTGESNKIMNNLLGVAARKLSFIPTNQEVRLISRLTDEIHNVYGFFTRFEINADHRILAKVMFPEAECETPAVIESPLGLGKVVTLAALPNKSLLKELVRYYSESLGLEAQDLPPDVELIRLYDSQNRLTAYLIINQNRHEIQLELKEWSRPIILPGKGFKLLKDEETL